MRIHASYGCTIKIGKDQSTITGGHFFHGGTSLEVMPDCGPGSWVRRHARKRAPSAPHPHAHALIGASLPGPQIDIIPEDYRLLAHGRKRLKFDASCGIIPACGANNGEPMPPPSPSVPPLVSPSPSPPYAHKDRTINLF